MTADPRGDTAESHYDVLGVPRDADRQQIARAYRAAMRRLHPDVGAPAPDAGDTAEQIAAVQEAWRTLGDAASRGSYDERLSRPSDGWVDLGWGVSVDDTADHDVPPPTVDVRAEGDWGVPDGDVQVEPWRTPFAPGAVRVPEPIVPSWPPRRGLLDWLLIALAAALGLVALVVGVWTRGQEADPVVFPGLPLLAAGVILAVSLLAVAGGLFAAFSEERGSETRAAGIGASGVMAVCLLASGPWAIGIPATVLGAAGAGALLLGFWAALRRQEALAKASADRVSCMTNFHRAAEWNRIRQALLAQGARVEESHGARNLDEPFRIRTVEWETGEEHLRDLNVSLPRGGWVVVDDSGAVLCTAPPGALEAWLAAWGEAAR